MCTQTSFAVQLAAAVAVVALAAWLGMSLVEWCVLVLSSPRALGRSLQHRARTSREGRLARTRRTHSRRARRRRGRRSNRRHRRRNRRRRHLHQPPLARRLSDYRPPNRRPTRRGLSRCPRSNKGTVPSGRNASTPKRAPRARSPSARATPTPAPAPSTPPAPPPRSARSARRLPASPPPGNRPPARRQSPPRPASRPASA